MHAKSAGIVLNRIKLETDNPFFGLSFFKNYLEEFNVFGQLIRRALFDLMLIYFSSVSYTQLLQTIDLEVVMKLRSIRPSALC